TWTQNSTSPLPSSNWQSVSISYSGQYMAACASLGTGSGIYISSNYDSQTAKQFTETMEQNYGIHSTSTEYPEEYSDPVIYGTTGPNSAASGG
ncbi:hypothetical protein EBR43_03955, partial [bacterium]|nr:hypothetical protein [bacterium]